MSFLKIDDKDNVCVACNALALGETVDVCGENVTALAAVPRLHKLACKDIRADEEVIKYGHAIGRALSDIKKGEHVHTHNLRSALDEKRTDTYQKTDSVTPRTDFADAEFAGYKRLSGAVGIRNDLLIVPTVGCAASACERIRRAFLASQTLGADTDVIVLNHPFGCSQLGGDQMHTQHILAGIAKNPNFGGVLVVSLGCENNGLDVFRPFLSGIDAQRLRFLVLQDTPDEIGAGVTQLKELYAGMRLDRREPCSISGLCIGIKCGGSDALSGITANPLTGEASDYLTGAGGSVLMSEIPEMFGAEQGLLSRCASRAVFEALDEAIGSFKDYYVRHGEKIYENPSPGNREGGITTLEEKSLGCVKKGGGAEIVGVIAYGAQRKTTGLTVLSAPGNDIVSLSALAAAGAQLVLFTTGRGTPLGGPVPVLKIASNAILGHNKPDWIDFDADTQIQEKGFAAAGKALMKVILQIAGGEKTSNEKNGYHDFAIWKNGVTL